MMTNLVTGESCCRSIVVADRVLVGAVAAFELCDLATGLTGPGRELATDVVGSEGCYAGDFVAGRAVVLPTALVRLLQAAS